jgi:hypothetical protein
VVVHICRMENDWNGGVVVLQRETDWGGIDAEFDPTGLLASYTSWFHLLVNSTYMHL